LRYALKHSSDIDLHTVTIIENEWKKPLIQGHDLHFNLTHSGDWVMCIIDNKEAGVDVEKIKKVDYGIVPRFFSQHEQTLFETCGTDHDRLSMFTTIWVLKESYIKAIGRGLYCPLDSFSTIPDLSRSTVTLKLNDPSLPQKFFKLYDIGEEYRCAVCCSENRFPETVTIVSVESLTS
jgi:4'-phosphopantetheinyl transferase